MSAHHFAPLMPHALTPLEEWRAQQHDDQRLTSDHQLEAFLAETSPDRARLDLLPTSPVEQLMLSRAAARRGS